MLQDRGMKGDYSWNHSAREYLKLYEKLLKGEKKPPRTPSAEKNPVVVDIQADEIPNE